MFRISTWPFHLRPRPASTAAWITFLASLLPSPADCRISKLRLGISRSALAMMVVFSASSRLASSTSTPASQQSTAICFQPPSSVRIATEMRGSTIMVGVSFCSPPSLMSLAWSGARPGRASKVAARMMGNRRLPFMLSRLPESLAHRNFLHDTQYIDKIPDNIRNLAVGETRVKAYFKAASLAQRTAYDCAPPFPSLPVRRFCDDGFGPQRRRQAEGDRRRSAGPKRDQRKGAEQLSGPVPAAHARAGRQQPAVPLAGVGSLAGAGRRGKSRSCSFPEKGHHEDFSNYDWEAFKDSKKGPDIAKKIVASTVERISGAKLQDVLIKTLLLR